MTLSGYNPLAFIGIHGTESFRPNGLVVIVGPNCSGKTQLLRDVEKALNGSTGPFVVAEYVQETPPPDGEQFLDDLIKEMYVRRAPDDPNNSIELYAPYRGAGSGTGGKIPISQLKAQCSGFGNTRAAPEERAGYCRNFFGAYGRLLLTSLFAANRLTSTVETEAFDTEVGVPQNDLQVLYNNPEVKRKLAAETGRVFGNAAWVDNTRGDGKWRIKVSGRAKLPPADDLMEAARVIEYNAIVREGDGYKSYVAIAVSLLLGRRPVCLIDEPELHLHPPQAYALGQFIGRHGRSKQQATFVSTHSSHVLRGILSTGKDDITVIRLTRVGKQSSAHRLDNAELRAATVNPRSRTETILDGVFSQAVAIVEAEGDRVVYQAASEGIPAAIQELHFVPVHGTGGIDRILKFYRRLKVPVAVIPDCDIVGKSGELKAITKELAEESERAELVRLAKETITDIMKIPPAVTVEDAKQELATIGASISSWDQEDDTRVRRELERLRDKLYRLRRLKDEGVEGYKLYDKIYLNLKSLVERCRRIGLFLVHVGDLENWVPELMQGAGKGDKGAWADTASERIRANSTKTGDVWDFMLSVLEFLEKEQKKLSG